jgi:hypothetical protein
LFVVRLDGQRLLGQALMQRRPDDHYRPLAILGAVSSEAVVLDLVAAGAVGHGDLAIQGVSDLLDAVVGVVDEGQ